MSQHKSRTLHMVTQPRRGRSSMRATMVAPLKTPDALRDLYLNAGSMRRRTAVTGSSTRVH